MSRVRRCRYKDCHKLAEFPAHYCQKHYEYESEYIANRAKWARARSESYTKKYNNINRNRSAEKREQYSFYKTKLWVSLRKQALERDYYCCQYCLAKGVVKQGKIADHVVPVEFAREIRDKLDNIVTSCYQCHKIKTDWETAYYGTGAENTLKNVEAINDIALIVKLMSK